MLIHASHCCRLSVCSLAALVATMFSGNRSFAAEFTVTPEQVRIDEPEGTQQLLVSTADERSGTLDATRASIYRSEDPGIADVDERGLVRPLKDGRTTIIVEHDGARQRVEVIIEN